MKSKSLIGLFKEQLENESATIAKSFGLTKRGDYLIWWYFLKLLNLYESDIDEIICDGSGDLGIDAIFIDEENFVHFFQFKNPESPEKVLDAGDIDKMISGLQLILSKDHKKIANDELKGRIDEIYQSVPSGYRLHVVTSGKGIPDESHVKLDSFIKGLQGPSDDFIYYVVENINYLQDRFYNKTLPTIEEQIIFEIERGVPYQVRSADHDCYIFHTSGSIIAKLYNQHGEQLLQQNIRVYQGEKSTNASIRETCTGKDSANFFHFNNGITFLCEHAVWDQFTGRLTITRAQIVNGGQTARVIHRSFTDTKLKNDVLVPIRVITSQGDKEFASNVAVNLNNQNKVDNSFLRSNHPHIIQLANSLATLGWYLERREGEVKGLTIEESKTVESKIGNQLKDHTIKLKEGAQAFAATYYRQPELAKKNLKYLFMNRVDGGHFEQLFNFDLTAEKFLNAITLKKAVDQYIKQFGALKRRKTKDNTVVYDHFFSEKFLNSYGDMVDQAIPQSAVFLTAIIFELHIKIREEAEAGLIKELHSNKAKIVENCLSLVFTFALKNPSIANKAWPNLLKSQSFFTHVCSYIAGIEQQKAERVH